MTITIADYITQSLYRLGIKKIYGVAGDFNLPYLESLENSDIQFIGNCNEYNTSIATDGYARINGIGALVITYGVGDLPALSGVAGAYAEYVPIVVISGVPPLHAITSGSILHHTTADGNYDNILNCMKEFTVAQARITPENAVNEINRVLRTCWQEKRPVYLQLPSDICLCQVDVPDIFPDLQQLIKPNQSQLHQATKYLIDKINHSQRPLIIIDILAQRHQITPLLELFITKTNIPFILVARSRFMVDETLPSYLGTYLGLSSQPHLLDYINKADCIIEFGVFINDFDSSHFKNKYRSDEAIKFLPYALHHENNHYYNFHWSHLLNELNKNTEINYFDHQFSIKQPISIKTEVTDSPLTADYFWPRVADFIQDDDVVIVDSGTSSFTLLKMEISSSITLISQLHWGAIGFCLPAALGVIQASPNKRHLLFVGDGAFQVTAQELSTLLRLKLKPIIFLINNDGYLIERLILGQNSSYNDIMPWKYHQLLDVFADTNSFQTFVIDNQLELDNRLNRLNRLGTPDKLTFIELKFDRMDALAAAKSIGKNIADYDYGSYQ